MTSLAEEFRFIDGMALAALVRAGQVSRTEALEAAIERIEQLNPPLNAVVTKMYDEARAATEDAANRPGADGPLAGVPFLLKDLACTYAGVRMTNGCAATRDSIPERNSFLVDRYLRSGLVVVGKTNTCEMGLMNTTEPLLFGPARNPWDTDRTTAGSSGGSGAAVASGMVPIAHGNDGGGSIRYPASACGVFGLKPSRGRITSAPDGGELLGGIANDHVLTRSVRDSAAVLDATAGAAPGDAYPQTPPRRPYLEEVGADPGRLRIAFSVDVPDGYSYAPDCVEAVRETARLCESLGHDVEEAWPDFIDRDELYHEFAEVMWASLAAQIVDGWAQAARATPTTDHFEPYTLALAEQGRGFTAADLLNAMSAMQALARKLGLFQEPYDAWIAPTLSEPPLPLGSFESTPSNPLRPNEVNDEFGGPYTQLCNITGQPAASVPLGWSGSGLPIGVHVAARYGDEATLFRLCSQLEAALPWADRHPPDSAWLKARKTSTAC